MDVSAISGSNPAPTVTATDKPAKAVAAPSFREILAKAAAPKPEPVAKAATQFEALILGQVLKTVHDSSDGGWLGTGEDQAGSMAVEMAEQHFAEAMAENGGMGVAKMVTKQLHSGPKTASSGLVQRAP